MRTVTKAQAAAILHISPNEVVRRIEEGEIKAKKKTDSKFSDWLIELPDEKEEAKEVAEVTKVLSKPEIKVEEEPEIVEEPEVEGDPEVDEEPEVEGDPEVDEEPEVEEEPEVDEEPVVEKKVEPKLVKEERKEEKPDGKDTRGREEKVNWWY